MKNFALIGAAGYIAPRHLSAIKETNSRLVIAYDKSDSVGIMDSFFPGAAFYKDFERFESHVDQMAGSTDKVDIVSIASPNNMHDSHIKFGLRHGADVICEKPLVLTIEDLEGLASIEAETNKKVFNILQLRLHPSLIDLKRRVDELLKAQPDKVFDIDLTYITGRGAWYYESWKGDEARSGGIASNIGVHFFDMLSWIFGAVKSNILHFKSHSCNSGHLELEHARVRWFLSLDAELVPADLRNAGARTYRCISVDDEEIEFSGGFTDLHTQSYQQIISGNGFGIQDARACIEIVENLRTMEITHSSELAHPFLKLSKQISA